ncbi:UNVERIFIED_CONTAM: hypothetical protein RMT77_009648 [Armadillidium vulgare]
MANVNKTHKKFVEVGRVAYAAKGPEKGKLFAIIDVIDYNRVLVDGPEQGSRREEKLSNLSLTKYKIRIQHGQSTKLVKKAWAEGQITQKWSKSDWAKKFARRDKIKALSDFERFKVAHLKKAKNKAVERALKINRTCLVLLKQKKQIKLRTVKKDIKPPQKPKAKKISKVFGRLRSKGYLKKEKDEKVKKLKKPRREETEKDRRARRKAKSQKGAKKTDSKKIPESAKKRDPKKPAPSKKQVAKKTPASAKKQDPKKPAPQKKQDSKKTKQATKPPVKQSDGKSKKTSAK